MTCSVRPKSPSLSASDFGELLRFIKLVVILVAGFVGAGIAGAQPQPDSLRPESQKPTVSDTLRSSGDTLSAADVMVGNRVLVGEVTHIRPIPASGDCPINGNQLNAVRAGVATAFVGGNAYLYHYFKKAWWSGERSDGFFWNADWDMEFRDQDKFGHMLGGYHLTRIGYAGLRAACVSKTKALVASSVYAALFQLQIEIFDARFEKYGFSYPDLLANTAGQVFAIAQELNPKLKAFKPTFSYRQTRALKSRVAVSELRPSIDYSGQTYWVSTDVDMLLPDAAKPYWPSFVRLSAGHSITDWTLESGTTQRAKRKILLSLD